MEGEDPTVPQLVAIGLHLKLLHVFTMKKAALVEFDVVLLSAVIDSFKYA